jgi:hypothetical protein
MTCLRGAVDFGAVVIAALASAFAGAGRRQGRHLQSYAGGSQPVGLGNGWYVAVTFRDRPPQWVIHRAGRPETRLAGISDLTRRMIDR